MNEIEIKQNLRERASSIGLDIEGGQVRRSSSRYCLGVEHGDYNGCELFGVGTDRFIWLAFKPNNSGRVRIFSENFPDDGLVEFNLGEAAEPGALPDSWARFPHGVEYILRREGYGLTCGFDAVLYGNIPGGGMSRSASLSLNLIETFFEVSGIVVDEGMRIVDLAQMVEVEYIGSPCGKLDQIMIYFAREGMGTYFNPRTLKIEHIPFGGDSGEFLIVSMDTGTNRPGLEKSTYKVRREECDALAEFLNTEMGLSTLGDINTDELYKRVQLALENHPLAASLPRVKYIYEAQQRFHDTLDAWRSGDIARVGSNFRQDGIGLRDDYQISGPELESMCDIVRTVDGVYGERMLGGGDKGASGALVRVDAFEQLKASVERSYPASHPAYADLFAVHACRTVDGLVCSPLNS
ncbi:MAG: galactokinase [Lentimonas sp.]|jgi:galactokinase